MAGLTACGSSDEHEAGNTMTPTVESSAGGPAGGSGGVAGAEGVVGAGDVVGPSGAAGTASMGGGGGELAGAGRFAEMGGSGGEDGTPNECPPATPLIGGNEYCSNNKGNMGNGYGYELWADGGGSGCMTVHGTNATFSASWSNVYDFLGRVGLDFDQSQTHTQIGTISAEFAETKTDDGGLTYVGIYGWTVNPLREFYILDDWGSAEKPGGTSSDGTPRNFVGTLTADGETYDVWTKKRENMLAITGDSETFDQYLSIRRTARQCGTISVSEHFTQWEELGLDLGNLHEIKLLVEAQFNSGSIALTTATVTVE